MAIFIPWWFSAVFAVASRELLPPARNDRARLDLKPAADRLPAEQHAKAHRIAPGERQLDGPALAGQFDFGQDHRPNGRLAGRAADGAAVDQRSHAFDRGPRIVLEGMDLEADHLFRLHAGNLRTSKACNAELRAPVSTLTLMAAMPRSGTPPTPPTDQRFWFSWRFVHAGTACCARSETRVGSPGIVAATGRLSPPGFPTPPPFSAAGQNSPCDPNPREVPCA